MGDLELTTTLLNEQRTAYTALNRQYQNLQQQHSDSQQDLTRLRVERETQQEQGVRREQQLLM